MECNDTMKVDFEGWIKAVKEEHDRMEKHKVLTPVKLSKVPKGTKILTSTWEMKKKPSGKYRA